MTRDLEMRAAIAGDHEAAERYRALAARNPRAARELLRRAAESDAAALKKSLALDEPPTAVSA